MKPKVLVVDDSMYMRSVITNYLKEENIEIVGEAATGEDAIDMALELQPDLITLDIILPDMIGLDIIRTLKEEGLTSKIIMISVVGQKTVIDSGLELGANAYLIKPFIKQTFIETIEGLFPSRDYNQNHN